MKEEADLSMAKLQQQFLPLNNTLVAPPPPPTCIATDPLPLAFRSTIEAWICWIWIYTCIAGAMFPMELGEHNANNICT